MSRFGLVVRLSAGKLKDAGSVSRFGLVVRLSAGKLKDAVSTPPPGLAFLFLKYNCGLRTLSCDFCPA